ncbi:MAG: Sec-independent protein translocase protein TatB [Novosphingobium sp.]
MFDVGMDEMLVIAVVAIVVIGPKDLPLALRTVGRWTAKIRTVSGHFRAGIDTMIREAELAEMEKKWREQNAAIMADHPDSEPDIAALSQDETAESGAPFDEMLPLPGSKAEMLARDAGAQKPAAAAEPSLPFPPQ